MQHAAVKCASVQSSPEFSCHGVVVIQEKALRENKDDRRSKDITELVKLREQERTLKFEANQAKELLQREQEHTQRLLQQVKHQQNVL